MWTKVHKQMAPGVLRVIASACSWLLCGGVIGGFSACLPPRSGCAQVRFTISAQLEKSRKPLHFNKMALYNTALKH